MPSISIIPSPEKVEILLGEFRFSLINKFFIDPGLNGLCIKPLQLKELFPNLDQEIYEYQKNEKYIISFLYDSILGEEAYKIHIENDSLSIYAMTEKGIFYAWKSLYQMIIPNFGTIQNCKIFDVPRFAYRGFMLDIARHFFSIKEIKKIISEISCLKINFLHLHLSDDQGWRLEIKKYPRLTNIGSSNTNAFGNEKKPHKLFYTQLEIKDLIQYAQERYVTIIPEIDIPGHTSAILASYQDLGCKGKGYNLSSKGGVHNNILCTSERVFIFLEEVLLEISDIFPSLYIHIGGDECVLEEWGCCIECQNRMKKLNIGKLSELKSYFMIRIQQYIYSLGKIPIVWDEALEGIVMKDTLIHLWRREEEFYNTLISKNKVIWSVNTHNYLNYDQSDLRKLPINRYLPLEKVYFQNFGSISPDVFDKYVYGIEACLWSEDIKDFPTAEFMIFPRILAFAERAWSSSIKNSESYRDFLAQVGVYNTLLERRNIKYYNTNTF